MPEACHASLLTVARSSCALAGPPSGMAPRRASVQPNGIEPLPRILTCASARAARADSQRFDPVTHRLLLVLYITPSLPSSQTALSLLHAKGESRVAARLSQLYVPQYLLSIATIAANVAVAVNLIGDAPLPLASSNQSGVQ